jgi:hypothetical protein
MKTQKRESTTPNSATKVTMLRYKVQRRASHGAAKGPGGSKLKIMLADTAHIAAKRGLQLSGSELSAVLATFGTDQPHLATAPREFTEHLAGPVM